MAHRHGSSEAQERRDDLTGEHRASDAGQVALACLFGAIWIADAFFFRYTTFLNEYVPAGARIPFGIVLLAVSGYLARTGLSIVFRDEREKPGVIRRSVFGVARHPVYLSEILAYLGCLMLSISLAAAVLWVVAIGFLHYISRYEERLLLARFGKDYERYMQEVPMWFPRFWKR